MRGVYRKEVPLYMENRQCNTCKETKPLSEFYPQGKYKDGRPRIMRKCKICDNKRERLDRSNKQSNQRPRLKAWLRNIKSELLCVDCKLQFKNKEWLCDFHHINSSNKEFAVASMIARGMARTRIQAEIDKCIPLCSNCHRTRHHLGGYQVTVSC